VKICLRLAVVAAMLAFASACSSTPIKLTHLAVPSLKAGPASFDVIEIDQKAHRLYAADRTDSGVDVFDTSAAPAKFVKTITMPAEPNGIAVAPELNRAFAGLSDGSLAIIDTKAGSLIKNVATGGKSVDLIDYSPQTRTVYAANGTDGTIASVDALTGTVNASFKIGYAIEQPRFNPADHMLYVASPDAGALFRLDPRTGKIKDRIALSGCQARGLAINPKQDQALIACSGWVIRLNLRNPSDAAGFTQVGGGDVITYDATIDRFFVAAPGARPSRVALFGGDPIDYVTSVDTGGMGNSAAYDEKNGMVYTPDVMPGKTGLDAFKAPNGDLVFSFAPSTVAVVLGVVAASVILLFAVGRLADPVRRPRPAAPRAAPTAAAPVAVVGGVRPGARKWTRKA
jgi:hypothetical protein